MGAAASIGLGVAACGSSGDDSGDTATRSGSLSDAASAASVADAGWPACTYDPTVLALTSAEAGVAPVGVSRTYLSCALGDATEDCASDDPSSCSDHGAGIVGATEDVCTPQCSLDEYAVDYDVGPQVGADGGGFVPTAPVLPAACRSLLAGPGGGLTYCCPCGG